MPSEELRKPSPAPSRFIIDNKAFPALTFCHLSSMSLLHELLVILELNFATSSQLAQCHLARSA